MRIRYFKSGYCEAHEKAIDPRKPISTIEFAAIWALFDLESGGYAMYDTGYSEHFNTATQPFPDRFYRWITPIHLEPHESAIQILAKLNIQPDEIKYIVISHFHADHIAGIKDFPAAQFICTESALKILQSTKGLSAVKNGILHGLIPTNFNNRVSTIESLSQKTWSDSFGLNRHQLDLFPGIDWVCLPGHARGMLGFEYHHNGIQIFFAVDASWSHESFKDAVLPFPIVRVFIDSWLEMKNTLNSLHQWQATNPTGKIHFTHCPKALELLNNE